MRTDSLQVKKEIELDHDGKWQKKKKVKNPPYSE